ncbi:ankyrin repeat domain-containing protein [Aquibaculum sediminis]|uniref:ankyrin repeat domain-containing protein n=1 Tax=Aquibaculum sediminis TaxID=3231907 RepID=UPI0034529F7E
MNFWSSIINIDKENIAERRLIAEYRRDKEWKPLRDYFSAVKTGDAEAAEKLLEAGVSINAVEPTSTLTALHYAAARQADAVTEMLLARGGIDHLKRDGFGRLASEHAGRFGENPELADRLRTLEAAQAQEQGITLTYRPRPAGSTL